MRACMFWEGRSVGNNKNLMYLVCLFVTVLSILVWGLGINWRSSTMLALGAVAIITPATKHINYAA